MSPRTRARVRAVQESRAMHWLKALMPLLTILLSGFAMRQSGQAKTDNENTASAVGAMVQDNADIAKHHQADDRRLFRLEREVASLKSQLGRGRRVAGEPLTGVRESESVATAESVTLPTLIGGVARAVGNGLAGIGHFLGF